MAGSQSAGDAAFIVETTADAVDGDVNVGQIATKLVTGGLSKATDNALTKADLPIPKFSKDPNTAVSNTREVLKITSNVVISTAENAINSYNSKISINENPLGGGRDNTTVEARLIKPFKKP